jgi:Mlc titration factor MtfA (ptsG expression regulator)
MQVILLVISILILIAVFVPFLTKKKPLLQPAFETERKILQQYVLFYQKLSVDEKKRFEDMLQKFLQKVRITGIKTVVEDMDRVFIAAAAIIPIFAFKDWQYSTIHEVLLYPDSFTNDYHIDGKGRNTLGMVGTGPLQYEMILSQKDVRNGFLNHTDKSNTAIHEFVHLVDKADGDTDGLPLALLPHRYSVPWLNRIHQEIKQIKSGNSDINPYATTNEAEFLAVAAEYFFEQPHLMQEKHPELFAMLMQIFTPPSFNK